VRKVGPWSAPLALRVVLVPQAYKAQSDRRASKAAQWSESLAPRVVLVLQVLKA
jgi:hypothetical protein